MQNASLGHSAILLTFIQLPFVFKTFVLSIFEWPLNTGFTVFFNCKFHIKVPAAIIMECFTLVLNCSLTLIEPLKIWRVGMGLNEPVREISNNVVCVTSKASDQPAHTRRLIRAFASR